MWLNESMMTNRRRSIPLRVKRRLGRGVCATTLIPAAVAYLNRSIY
jgi:hypothetical protein